MNIHGPPARDADPIASTGRWASRSWCHRALNLIFPLHCVLCQDELPEVARTPLLCADCRRQLAAFPGRRCYQCGRPQPPLRPTSDGCVYCQREKNSFHQLFCLGPYQGTLRDAILRMKHLGQTPLTYAVGCLLATHILEADVPLHATQLVPQPMHWRRRLMRGEGTPSVLAQALRDRLQLPLARGLLRCRRPTKKQSLLAIADRRANVRGAFRVNPRQTVHRHVALIDDTLTTGATANEVARLLRRAGAVSVTVVVAARALERELHESQDTTAGNPR